MEIGDTVTFSALNRYNKSVLDVFKLVSDPSVTSNNDNYSNFANVPIESVLLVEECEYLNKNKLLLKLDYHAFSLFKYILMRSYAYRSLVFNNFKHFGTVMILVEWPFHHILDYKWNCMLEYTVRERCELLVAMSWLSTLGGAFSSVGDSIASYAQMAGTISVRQFSLALRLGDPPTVIRCKLYFCVSLIQQRKYGIAKRMIRQQYTLAKSLPILDNQLKNMCQGIWAKLGYELKMSKQAGS